MRSIKLTSIILQKLEKIAPRKRPIIKVALPKDTNKAMKPVSTAAPSLAPVYTCHLTQSNILTKRSSIGSIV